jgi:hypothetical protein
MDSGKGRMQCPEPKDSLVYKGFFSFARVLDSALPKFALVAGGAVNLQSDQAWQFLSWSELKARSN